MKKHVMPKKFTVTISKTATLYRETKEEAIEGAIQYFNEDMHTDLTFDDLEFGLAEIKVKQIVKKKKKSAPYSIWNKYDIER